MTDEINEVAIQIGFHLDEIAKFFKNPRITLVVRNPDTADADFVLTEDDLDKVIMSIETLRSQNSGTLN